MNKAQKATYPISANLHGGWSNINTSSIYWKVFENEGFVLGDLYFVGYTTNELERLFLK